MKSSQRRVALVTGLLVLMAALTPGRIWGVAGPRTAEAAVTSALATFDLVNPTIETGSLSSGTGANLKHDDQLYYAVSSTSASPYKAAWWATTQTHVPRTAVTKLTLTFDSKYSTATNDQYISFWNYLTGNWDVVIQAATTTADITRTYTTTDPVAIQKFISPKGVIKARIYNSASTTFIRYGDRLNVTIEYAPQAANAAYSPTWANAEYGTVNAGTYASLAADDSAYYSLHSTTASPYKAAWQAGMTISQDPKTVSALTLAYNGKLSVVTNDQHLSLFNWKTSGFDVVRQAPATTTDSTLLWTTTDAEVIQKYVSATGEIKVRLYNSAAAAFDRDSDYVNIYLEYGSVSTFTFAQYTDVHVPESGTYTPLQNVIADLNSIRPAFAVNTGDTASYAKAAEFDNYVAQIGSLTVTRYETAGNHDVRWFAHNGKEDFVTKLGQPTRSFDYGGVHFIVMDTSVFMENDGALDPGALDWVRNDLAGVSPATPVFLFAHHPNENIPLRPDLIEFLKDYNVKAFLGGHDHAWEYWTENGFIWEGSKDVAHTSQYALVTVNPTHIRIDKRDASTGVTTAWLKVPTAKQAGTHLTVNSATADATTGNVTVSTTVDTKSAPVTTVEARIDGGSYGPWTALAQTGTDVWEGTITISGYLPTLVRGKHFVEVRATDEDGLTWKARAEYLWSDPNVSGLWEFATGGAIQAAPAVYGGTVYVGSNDGTIYAVDAATGAQNWAYPTGGPVVSTPAIYAGAQTLVIAGSQDHKLYALDTATGNLVWSYTTGGAVLSSPLVADGIVYFGSGDKQIYALDAATGSYQWSYLTEGLMRQRPLVSSGVLYAIVRDTKVWYAINTADGSLKWQQNANTGNSYMPITDNSPVAANGELWVTKPDYTFSTLNMATGAITWTETTADEFSARGPVAAGGRVYVSARSDTVYAWDAATHSVAWTRPLPETSGEIQHTQVNSALVYSSFGGGRLYRVADRGRITSIDAATGSVIWEYDAASATERVFWSTPAVENDTVYVGGLDGRLYAVQGP